MGIRLVLTLIVLIQLSTAVGLGVGSPVAARVEDEGGMCWVPDVEFPVPCEEDDD
jgi:hypothetical protein